MKGMILAAGLGTRLKPFTDQHPKALAVVNNKTLLQRNIEYLQQHNIYEVIINVHHFAEQITNIIEVNNGWGSNIVISDETDAVLETGGGLKKAAVFLEHEQTFVLMNCDVLTDLDLSSMISYHKAEQPLATLAVTERTTSRYFLFDEKLTLCGWRNINTGDEKIARSSKVLQQKAFSGIHVLSNRIFDLMQQEGKFSMVDVYLSLAATEKILAFDHSDSKFIDVGKPESIQQAEVLFV